MSFNVYARESCYAPDKDRKFLASFPTMKEAWDFMKKHYGKEIPYIRTLLIHENEHLYDVGSYVQFYSIENTDGEMIVYWRGKYNELP